MNHHRSDGGASTPMLWRFAPQILLATLATLMFASVAAAHAVAEGDKGYWTCPEKVERRSGLFGQL